MTEKIELDALLDGHGRGRSPWLHVPLTGDLNSDEWNAIEQFRVRAHELLLNLADLKLGAHLQAYASTAIPRANFDMSGYPGRHRAKGLFLDFRHLYAQKEPGKFRRTRKIVRERSSNEAALRVFLDRIDELFLPRTDDLLEFMGTSFTIEKLWDIWFNTELFHSGNPEQTADRQRILEVLNDRSAAIFVFWSVVRAASPVKFLYACVRDLRRDSLVVRCPAPR